MLKAFGFRKLEEEAIPKLSFGKKLGISAYKSGRLHPVLEGLLHYLYFHGSVSSRTKYDLRDDEMQTTSELIKNLKKGTFCEIDATVHTPIVVLAVFREYIYCLPKRLFRGIKTRDWCQLCDMLPELGQDANEIALKERYAEEKLQKMILQLKFRNRSFAEKVMLTMHEMAKRSEAMTHAAMKLANFMVPVLLYTKKINARDEQNKADLVNCLSYMILHAPKLFSAFPKPLMGTIPIRNIQDEELKITDDVMAADSLINLA